ncbi:hypothetical protein WICPIJ_007894 [Wickerhamomyces pijperi]|uniref:Uncharacterized protein n=1 Tax=Wickerhamomyces pijperi TaxID=599730 RepID=A0A9P8PZP9_WICPI|nr:hypothetical protein WICPIJ_007894 [Wickerhamomyces pijperi]
MANPMMKRYSKDCCPTAGVSEYFDSDYVKMCEIKNMFHCREIGEFKPDIRLLRQITSYYTQVPHLEEEEKLSNTHINPYKLLVGTKGSTNLSVLRNFTIPNDDDSWKLVPKFHNYIHELRHSTHQFPGFAHFFFEANRQFTHSIRVDDISDGLVMFQGYKRDVSRYFLDFTLNNLIDRNLKLFPLRYSDLNPLIVDFSEIHKRMAIELSDGIRLNKPGHKDEDDLIVIQRYEKLFEGESADLDVVYGTETTFFKKKADDLKILKFFGDYKVNYNRFISPASDYLNIHVDGLKPRRKPINNTVTLDSELLLLDFVSTYLESPAMDVILDIKEFVPELVPSYQHLPVFSSESTSSEELEPIKSNDMPRGFGINHALPSDNHARYRFVSVPRKSEEALNNSDELTESDEEVKSHKTSTVHRGTKAHNKRSQKSN